MALGVGCRLESQPRLADAPWPDQSQQAAGGISQQGGNLSQLVGSANKGGRL
jgi:hypothetical protein